MKRTKNTGAPSGSPRLAYVSDCPSLVEIGQMVFAGETCATLPHVLVASHFEESIDSFDASIMPSTGIRRKRRMRKRRMPLEPGEWVVDAGTSRVMGRGETRLTTRVLPPGFVITPRSETQILADRICHCAGYSLLCSRDGDEDVYSGGCAVLAFPLDRPCKRVGHGAPCRKEGSMRSTLVVTAEGA